MTSFECSWKRHALGQVSQNAHLVPFLQLLLGGQPKTERWHGVNFATVHKNCSGNISEWNTELMRMVDRKRIYWNLICDHPDEKNFINLLIVSLFSPDVHTNTASVKLTGSRSFSVRTGVLGGEGVRTKLKSRRLYKSWAMMQFSRNQSELTSALLLCKLWFRSNRSQVADDRRESDNCSDGFCPLLMTTCPCIIKAWIEVSETVGVSR